jgi:GNAT superfamily N-acetyltransferase
MDGLDLPDGTHLDVRPLEPSDMAQLEKGFEHLSPRSRYRRFFTTLEQLSQRELTYLTTLDHDRHEALVAIDPQTHHGVAIARYVVIGDAPPTAEIAVTVNDAWQGIGVGTALMRELAVCARAHGIVRFSGLVLGENTPMLRLLSSSGNVLSRTVEDGTVELLVEIEAVQPPA